MNLTVLAVGNKMPKWVNDVCADYAKRFGRDIQFKLKEIKPENRNGISAAQAMTIEAERLQAAIPEGALPIILDERGQTLTSMQLADYLQKWLQEGVHPCWIIGGADGIAPEFKAKTGFHVRLSNLTLPHGLVRVLLTEQLYRAYSIVHHHPYHRE